MITPLLWPSICALGLLVLAGCEEDRNGKTPETGSETGEVSAGDFLRDSLSYLLMQPNPTPLQYGAGSIDEMADRVLRAISELDTAALADIAISAEEWREILYPEMGLHFPGARDSRPAIRDMLGELHFNSSVKGLRRLLRDYGGEPMGRVSLEIEGDTLRFPSYTLYTDPVLRVRGGDGTSGSVAFLGSIVEKDGTLKLLSWREDEVRE